MNSNSTKKLKRPKPVILVVLDGWGIAQPYSGNAISQADTPTMNELLKKYPSMTIRASGEAVGLPWGESGNSEVGHLNLGLGRIHYQDLPRINKAISDNSFYKNKALLKAINHVKKNKSCLHLLGLTSNGGVHASIDHLQALIALAKEYNIKQVYIHAILDGRDTPYNSGLNFIKDIERFIAEYKTGEIATISGRFYAMDRDNHWDRIAKAYKTIALGQGLIGIDPVKAIENSYAKKIYDEEFAPIVMEKIKKINKVNIINDNDAVIFFNFRSDRARQITRSFVLPSFDKFDRGQQIKNLLFVCFSDYGENLPVEVAFLPEVIKNTLGEIISRAGLKQLRIAETEKYAHVTYFFNGGNEDIFEGETHELIPSPRVNSYDLCPEMSSLKLTNKLIEEIEADKYDFILVNYANADMVGHTGNLPATIKAVGIIDKCMAKILKKVLDKDGCLIITADHGNAEVVFNMQTGTIDKEHSSNPVPFIVISNQFEGRNFGGFNASSGDLSLTQPQGILSDVAPTILKIMGLEKPLDMTGRPLI
ncbi:2,3-bisphosphoglycerate-independent phosphoglycerate mutase [Candidatus Falkowbacteria bacterium CG_4_9_14_3_um_filter_36_9]|uniref:2,3-bisphosphoglycerate-independent phosphoglycerate mutase n=1 Tax=Candidatus Falkowbacteria bacterium CG02_land_8_20_14_3_00_36_14 TaxID=1974560 RepID=A0A2M7DNK7_9BACT|nr:MAG: 2,3-bisphosphoglycerate-independent phosphoglycerate mutase [Candidatus Falkowbacteria bacterium CG02_land_8_20_14_3_00_36_14]PIX11934.1 MAG: 2,3-bisphosphoglycerate-independent phosphoglycerate mutase [Candidatus Falkowbacteria bacterium CG_4_8_14_3_um_filter_36_11]PJB20836.1 MAG: 2,3-bisphosphoglycerate-independent phosphoglycerate mutase [Candidatus Falkowbacteria bacterium CG_4_9_14_3_um_filter_36_9]